MLLTLRVYLSSAESSSSDNITVLQCVEDAVAIEWNAENDLQYIAFEYSCIHPTNSALVSLTIYTRSLPECGMRRNARMQRSMMNKVLMSVFFYLPAVCFESVISFLERWTKRENHNYSIGRCSMSLFSLLSRPGQYSSLYFPNQLYYNSISSERLASDSFNYHVTFTARV